MKNEFQISYTVSSLHFSAFAVGILIIGIAGHTVIRRTGRGQALAVGAIGMGSGALLFVLRHAPALTIGAAQGDEARAGAHATLASGVASAPAAGFGRLADLAGLKAAYAVVAVLFAALLLIGAKN